VPKAKENKSYFLSLSISTADIQKIQEHVRELVNHHSRRSQWQPQLSRIQAEILSQLMTSGEIKIALDGSGNGEIAATILKEF
jgi:hypothetical protein